MQDKQLGGNRIKHARNGAEQVIQVKKGESERGWL